MNESQTIEIVVSPTGATTVQTKGFVGRSCRDASSFLERALGELADEVLTSEFYQQLPATEQVRQS